jgi:hypothetical protein
MNIIYVLAVISEMKSVYHYNSIAITSFVKVAEETEVGIQTEED